MYQNILRKIKLNFSLCVYILLALVPLVVITVFVIRMTTVTMTQNSQDLILYQANHVVRIFNDEAEALENIFYSVLVDTEIRSYCSEFGRHENAEYNTSLLKEKFRSYMTLSPNITQCLFICEDARYITAQTYRSNDSDTEWQHEEYRKEILDKILTANTLTTFPAQHTENSYEESPVFYIGIPFTNSITGRIYGVMIFGIQKSFFNSAFFETRDDESQQLPQLLQLAELILTDSEDTVIYASDPSMKGSPFSAYSRKHNLDEESYLVTEYTIDKTNWHFLSYCPKKIAFRTISESLHRLYIMIGFYAVFLIYTCVIIVSHQNRRIRRIADGIRSFRGDQKNYSIPLFSNENLNLIITQFNLMANRIYTLTESLKAEQEIKEKEMNLRRKAEIKILEAQINPHFLYNTLDTINWMAISKNEMEISSMIGNLGSLLRYSVTNIDSPVLIKAEIEWIKKYLFLQKKRFRELFTYDLEIEPAVEHMTIYKMLLQPLIENSIIHGFARIESGGYIRIKMNVEGSHLVLSIADNGSGINPQKLTELRQMAQTPNTYTGDNIGFFNVISRLHAYYKDCFCITIESVKGTVITLTLPI